MRRWVAALAAMCAAACSSSTGASAPTAYAAPKPATPQDLAPYYGSYAVPGGDVVVIARLGWYFDLADADYRTIYATRSPTRFEIGDRFEVPNPKFADLVFSGGGVLRIVTATATRTARHIAYRQSDVTVPAAGARLAAAITEPQSQGPHPGIVIVHGSEPGERYFYDVWVGIYASLGLDVLTYDKRGVGASTGTYPGEVASTATLQLLADDASAALAFLSRWPGVDPKRIGFHGGSQGGWTVPLSIARHGGAAFAVLVSAPATTVDQTDLWAEFTSHGATPPTESVDAMLASVRAATGGYDPAPVLRALNVVALWLLGTNDRSVPTALSVEIIDAMRKGNFTIHLLPTGHGLLVNPTGLVADDAQSPGMPPELVPDLRSWISVAAA